MKSYASGSNVALTIDIKDEDGTLIVAKSAAYTLYDSNDVEIEPETSVYDFAEGDASVKVVISEDSNTLSVGSLIEARRVLLRITTIDDEIVEVNRYYAISSSIKLAVLVNSYQTVQSAELLVINTSGLNSFSTATESEKIAALATAYERLGTLTYEVTQLQQNWQTTQMHWASDRDLMSNRLLITAINKMSLSEFTALPKEFLSKLRLAQVIEADAVLGGEDVRDTGLVSERVGESSKTWNAKKPLRFRVSKRTLEALAGYVNFSVKIGRV